jgi:hypothetical protein
MFPRLRATIANSKGTRTRVECASSRSGFLRKGWDVSQTARVEPTEADPAHALPTAQTEDAPAKAARRRRVLALLLLLALLLPWVPAAQEWVHYRDTASQLIGRRAWEPAEIAIVWVLFAKTQLVLLPAVVLAAVLVARGWWRSGIVLFVFATCAVLAWSEIDVQLYARTGGHLLDYAKFASEPGAMQWSGATGTTSLARVRESLTTTAQYSALVILVSVAAVIFAFRRWPRLARRAVPALIVMHVVTLVGVVPAQLAYPHREELQRLHAVMPYGFTWTAPSLGLVDVRRFTDPLNDHLRSTLIQWSPALRAGPPADTSAALPANAPRPNIVLIVIDSLRADAFVPEVMPRLTALSKSGLRLNLHYAGARISHFGLYDILYGRPAATYHPTLDAGVQPQACVTLRGSGYTASYVSGTEYVGWMGMERYIHDGSFDRIRVVGITDWPRSDRRALTTSAKMLEEAAAAPAGARQGGSGRPQFIVNFLVSTHYPYPYPPEFERRTPVLPQDYSVLTLDPARDRLPLLNRYHNACAYIDQIVAEFIARLDLAHTIVVITGDHGESFWDDGVIAHGFRWSDAQAHVPCVILGPGIPQREIDEPTEHQDLVPTLLHAAAGAPVTVRNVTGRDLLGDAPAPAMTIVAASSNPRFGEMLVEFRGRRLLFELPHDRPEVVLRGTVDRTGNINPWDVPPAAEAPTWADALGALLQRMTALRR